MQADKPRNLLLDGGVRRGNAAEAFAACAAVAEGVFETAFVEHAYIEPEAGWAERVGDRIEIHVTTQTPYMDRDEVANVMRLRPEAVRIVPTACGGGFGGKLDLSVQPLVALAAWKLGRPVACVYTRPESMAATTKRHPARVAARFGCDAEGKLLACDVTATFDTGAYASWGPTVANRVPVHAMGPYAVPNVRTWGEAFFTNGPPAGAFRGFGVPQAAIAHEAMMDELADRLGDRPAGVPSPQRAARRRHHGDGPDARPLRRSRPVPRGAAAALEEGARGSRCLQRAGRGRGAAASASAACGTASATPRCPTPRACASACRRPAR